MVVSPYQITAQRGDSGDPWAEAGESQVPHMSSTELDEVTRVSTPGLQHPGSEIVAGPWVAPEGNLVGFWCSMAPWGKTLAGSSHWSAGEAGMSLYGSVCVCVMCDMELEGRQKERKKVLMEVLMRGESKNRRHKGG